LGKSWRQYDYWQLAVKKSLQIYDYHNGSLNIDQLGHDYRLLGFGLISTDTINAAQFIMPEYISDILHI
jgi:hypothetical protein